MSCSLTELAHHLAAAREPAVLPNQCVGTRIVFRLVYPSTRYGDEGNGSGSSRPKNLYSDVRFITRDLGSVVLGGGGPGAPTSSLDVLDDYIVPGELAATDKIDNYNDDYDSDGTKTLADAHYVAGDFISCAILPPLANGCVAPASSARSGRGSGIGEAPSSDRPPSPPRRGTAQYIGSRHGTRGQYRWGFGLAAGEWQGAQGDVMRDDGAWIRDGGRRQRRDGRGDRDDRNDRW